MRPSVYELLPFLTEEEFKNELPPKMQELCKHLRIETVAKLIDAYGGIRLYVPMTVLPNHPLTLLLGLDEFERLVQLRGGEEHFDICICKNLFRFAQEKKMLALRDRGISLRELAFMFYMTERNVVKVVSKISKQITQSKERKNEQLANPPASQSNSRIYRC